METTKTFPTYIFGSRSDWSVLDLFCAGFLGSNTTRHIVPRARQYIGIDNDAKKLTTMRDLYRHDTVDLVNGDVYRFIESAGDNQYDVVICDQPTAHNEQLYNVLPDVAKMATDWILVSTNIQYAHLLPLEIGCFYLQCLWARSEYMGGTYWAVYKKI